MEWLTDPTIWAGLATLIVLEIVLGIDNLVFIAILADKLPAQQRDRARLTGLSLALFMRLGLLLAISWLATLTAPLLRFGGLSFSGRDLILFAGGLFLLFKATVELHERLEGAEHGPQRAKAPASFWLIVIQIVLLDIVFSLDSVITAVGMVNELWVMVTAVVIAMAVMLVASGPLTRFVNDHPTVVVLCLSFLLMIGLSLVADGFGFHIPKGYLYAAIGFSILIESLNQVARRNAAKRAARGPLRERTAHAILALLGARPEAHEGEAAPVQEPAPPSPFVEEERTMVSGVLRLADRPIASIMTPRARIAWVDMTAAPEVARRQILDSPHSYLPVCRGGIDDIAGVARAKDLLGALLATGKVADAALKPPVYVRASATVLQLMDVLKHAGGQFALVTDEAGAVLGLVTPVDVLGAIAGGFPDDDTAAGMLRAAPAPG